VELSGMETGSLLEEGLEPGPLDSDREHVIVSQPRIKIE